MKNDLREMKTNEFLDKINQNKFSRSKNEITSNNFNNLKSKTHFCCFFKILNKKESRSFLNLKNYLSNINHKHFSIFEMSFCIQKTKERFKIKLF